ncbi:MAG TPA: GAF domain-containing protein, partial [Chloroflexota bacterium]
MVQLRELFGVDVAGIFVWDGALEALRPFAQSHPRDRVRKQHEGVAGEAFACRQMVVAEDYGSFPGALPPSERLDVASAVGAPLLVDGRAMGAIILGSTLPRRFSADDRKAIEFGAEQLAPLVEAGRLRSELRRRHAEAEAMADLARQGVTSRSIQDLLSLLAHHTVSLLGADYAIVSALDERDKVSLRGASGVRRVDWQRRRALSRGGVSRAVLAARATVVVEHMDDVEHCPLYSPVHAAEGACTVLATHMPSSEGIRGVLHAAWRSPCHPGAEERRLLETLAAFGGSMLDNARGQERARRLAAQLQTVIDQMPSGVAVIDENQKLRVLNKAGRDIFGVPEDIPAEEGLRIGSRELRRVLEHGGTDLTATALWRARSGERLANYDVQLNRYDGRKVWLRATATPLLNDKGKPAGAISIFSDVTESKLLAEEMQRTTERRLARAGISEALSDASRDVETMLKVATREVGHAMDATCAIRLLVGGELRLVPGSVYDPDPELQGSIVRLLEVQPLPLRQHRHLEVMTSGKAKRWFERSGLYYELNPVKEAQSLLDRVPLYAMLVAPLQAHGMPLGTIGLYQHKEARPFSDEDEAWVTDMGARAGLALENAQLFQQLASSRARLEELSQRMVQLAERERRAIGLELHDEVGQGLTAARLLLEAARRLPARLRDERLEEACKTLDEAVKHVRGLSLDLRPPLMDRFGLAPALESHFERFSDRTGI